MAGVAPDLSRPSEWLKLLATFLRQDKTREGIGVLAMAMAILTLASLATFDSRDPSYFNYTSVSASERHIHNAVGRVGAELSGDLLGLFGLSALLVPPVFFIWGWTWVGGRRLAHATRRTAGLALLAPSLSLLASILHQMGVLPGGRVQRPGGFLGDELFRWLLFSLGKFGMVVLAMAGLALAAICLSQRPLLSFLALPTSSLARCWTQARASLAAWRAKHAPIDVSLAGPSKGPAAEVPTATAAPAAESQDAAALGAGSESTPKETKAPKEPKAQQAFLFVAGGQGYIHPSLKFLDAPSAERGGSSQEEMAQNSQILEKKLLEFGVEGRVTAVNPGPVITSYEIEPGPGIKINRIVALADDLALGLKALSVRVVAPIPGKAAVGVEIPNQHRATVHLREVLTAKEFGNESLQLPLALGKEIGGEPLVADLAHMPHLLIAGETGSGKSVCINSLILSLL
ncbi:MAG TPA: DNA translocase FtsK 4TM domain-containing protein, partial [Candidatus Acidoferrum sp.]|nr:DNA translocase FtsK 4TM domain-containing protein [Candidatus Acidoferrum sp.]